MKGTSVMWNYIREEQEVLGRMLGDKALFETASDVPELESVYIVAHGSSYNASVVMADFLSRYMSVRVYGYTPANFMHNCSSIKCENQERCMVVAISQTGTSRGLLEAAGLAKDMGFSVLGITQVKDSPLSHLADHCLYLECGSEESNAKTKGYSSTLLALMLFGLKYGFSHGKLEQRIYQAVLQELEQCINRLDADMDQVVNWCKKGGFTSRLENLYVLGAGMNYGTAMEGQLKLMETMCIPAMFNDIEEFSHGMHRSINERSSVILLNTDSLYTELMSSTFSYLMKKTDRVLMLYAGDGCICGDKVLKLDYYPLTQSVLVFTMALQVLSVFIPEAVGYDPNREANDDYTQYVHTRVS
ncbi:SIS domain-containing protein [Enterocloster aldenensis]|uniref:SIS domain-containing protein n=1 Tax=Enterocloster aldenensis TaxID=358742 RepID=UPI0025A416C2|nr:SIS domain-containing protein [Enterocloster aldenensis]